jgi:arylsulfatase A-like enzyme
LQLIDLFPTLLAAAGGTPDLSWRVDGVDLLASWTGRSPAPERTLFWEWRAEGSNQVAAMRGDLKLVVTGGGPPELFDLANDPAERIDVSAEHPEDCERLLDALETWLATAADPRGRGPVAEHP